MKNTLKNTTLLLLTSFLLVGCSNNHKVKLDRDEAKERISTAIEANVNELPEIYSIQSLVKGEEDDEIIGISLDSENYSLYYQVGDEIAKGYNFTEQEEDVEEIDFSEYTFDYSLDGGETYLEEPLVEEEAIAKFKEYEIKANAKALELLAEEQTTLSVRLTALEALEATIVEKEEAEEGDLRLDLSELYYASDYALHLGFSYQYGPIKPELDEEGEQVEDEDGNPSFYIDEESEAFAKDYLAIHCVVDGEDVYPNEFVTEEQIIIFSVDELVYIGEIAPEEE